MKKYGGKIEHWYKQDITTVVPLERLNEQHGLSLGFVVHGNLGKDHKNRGFDNGPIRTSLVVKFSDNQIETLNTIYDLGDPRI